MTVRHGDPGFGQESADRSLDRVPIVGSDRACSEKPVIGRPPGTSWPAIRPCSAAGHPIPKTPSGTPSAIASTLVEAPACPPVAARRFASPWGIDATSTHVQRQCHDGRGTPSLAPRGDVGDHAVVG